MIAILGTGKMGEALLSGLLRAGRPPSAVVAAARRHGGAILGIPCQDTLKRVNSKGEVVATVDRQKLWQVQTPQAFRAALLWRAYQEAMERGFYATDEAALVEALGETVVVVPGTPLNLKITTPDDLKMAEAILSFRQTP